MSQTRSTTIQGAVKELSGMQGHVGVQKDAIAAMTEAFGILAEGIGPDGTLVAVAGDKDVRDPGENPDDVRRSRLIRFSNPEWILIEQAASRFCKG